MYHSTLKILLHENARKSNTFFRVTKPLLSDCKIAKCKLMILLLDLNSQLHDFQKKLSFSHANDTLNTSFLNIKDGRSDI